MMWGRNLLQADLSVVYTKNCCSDLPCADFCWMSFPCTTSWLDLPQAAWGRLWYLFPRKGREWKERKIRFLHSGQAQYFLNLAWKYFLCIGRHRQYSENSWKPHCCLLVPAAARGSLKESLGGLVLDVGFRCSCPHRPLASLPNLASHSCLVREEENWPPAHNIRRFGAPCCCHFNFWAGSLPWHFLLFLPPAVLGFFFYSPDILRPV